MCGMIASERALYEHEKHNINSTRIFFRIYIETPYKERKCHENGRQDALDSDGLRHTTHTLTKLCNKFKEKGSCFAP